jgi:hypothetical protein
LGKFTNNPPRVAIADQQGNPTPEFYRWMASVTAATGADSGPFNSAQFLTLADHAGLDVDRVFTPVSGELDGSDGGANAAYTLGLASTTVVPSTYGAATKAVSLTVDSKGRLTAAAEYALITTNVTEGTNLYYTDARARAALSASAPLTYNSTTGAFGITGAALTKADDTNVTLTLGGTPATALLAAASLTLGWTGTLAVARGGTGAGTLTGYVKGNGTSAMTASSTIPNTDITGLGTASTQTYATGSCPLTITDSAGNAATMGASNMAIYTRIGNMVLVSGTLNWTSTAALTAGSRIKLTGLPFAANSTADYRAIAGFGSSAAGSFNITRAQIGFGVDGGNSFVWGTNISGNNVDGSMVKADIGNAGTLFGFTLAYQV